MLESFFQVRDVVFEGLYYYVRFFQLLFFEAYWYAYSLELAHLFLSFVQCHSFVVYVTLKLTNFPLHFCPFPLKNANFALQFPLRHPQPINLDTLHLGPTLHFPLQLSNFLLQLPYRPIFILNNCSMVLIQLQNLPLFFCLEFSTDCVTDSLGLSLAELSGF